MNRDEEKDLYIKSKLKDGQIPERIDNLFNNSLKLLENEGGSYREKNHNQPKKNQIILKRVAGIAACAVIALGGGNIYATTQGYDNVFFMIKEWVTPIVDVQGKDEILSDRDITISYKSIEVKKGIKVQINRLVIKNNEAILYLKINQAETELDIRPFTYIVRDQAGKEICNYTSTNKELIYNEQLKLDGLTSNAKKLELEIKQNNGETLVEFDIDLGNKEIEVIGNDGELQKLSEEELKKYLGAFALLNYEDDILNAGTVDKEVLENVRQLMVDNQIAKIKGTNIEIDKYEEYYKKDVSGLCIDVTDIMYSNGIYTVTFTYCYPTADDISQDRIEDLPLYEMTIGLTINEDETYSKYSVSSKMESKLLEPGNAESNIIEVVDEDVKKFIGQWELDYIMQAGDKYRYECSISDVRGTDKKVLLTIKEDGTFIESVQDDETYKGQYIKINENTIKRTYDDGFVVYTTCEQNELGETVISNICRMDQQKYEYYTKEHNIIKESLVGIWWRSFNVDQEEEYKLSFTIRSDGTFLESTVQEPDENGVNVFKTTGMGTYQITQNSQWDVVVLKYDNGETIQLLYGQKGTSKENKDKLHYSEGRQVFTKFTAVK